MTDDTAPEDHVHVWVPCREMPNDRRWELLDPAEAKQCRWTEHGQRCTEMSVARLDRTWRYGLDRDKPPLWWHYCESHLYGRRIVNGEIQVRILARLDPLPFDGGGS